MNLKTYQKITSPGAGYDTEKKLKKGKTWEKKSKIVTQIVKRLEQLERNKLGKWKTNLHF